MLNYTLILLIRRALEKQNIHE